MTTLEDGVAALLAEPLEQKRHAELVDRVCEDAPDPRRALLDLVIAHKASDGPRLAFALWCELNGDPERAEFVRVQCELAKTPQFDVLSESRPNVAPVAEPPAGPVGMTVYVTGEFVAAGGVVLEAANPRYAELARREQELLDLRHENVKGELPNYVKWLGGSNASYSWPGMFLPQHVRGFVRQVSPWPADWLAHGDAVVAEHPVERVVLRGRLAPGAYTDLRVPGWRWDVRDSAGAKAYLKAMWPGVKFVLPGA